MKYKNLILKKLNEIEAAEHVKILHAVESGSRAWGFASPDSDYDVRFIYIRPQNDYLQLQPRQDFIDWELNETLDINGWDLSKTLQHPMQRCLSGQMLRLSTTQHRSGRRSMQRQRTISRASHQYTTTTAPRGKIITST